MPSATTVRFGKVKQKKRALLVALYVLRKVHDDPTPRRRKVLKFVQSSRLLFIAAEDEEMCSAGCTIWQEELSYHRLSLKHEGLIKMPKWGIWQLTESGERDVEAWAQRVKKFTDGKPDWGRDFRAHANPEAEFEDQFQYEYYITEETVRWGIKIAANTLK